MEKLKHEIKIGDQVVFDLESIFLRLLLVGQQHEMELLPIFGYELCAVPPSLVYEYGSFHVKSSGDFHGPPPILLKFGTLVGIV